MDARAFADVLATSQHLVSVQMSCPSLAVPMSVISEANTDKFNSVVFETLGPRDSPYQQYLATVTSHGGTPLPLQSLLRRHPETAKEICLRVRARDSSSRGANRIPSCV